MTRTKQPHRLAWVVRRMSAPTEHTFQMRELVLSSLLILLLVAAPASAEEKRGSAKWPLGHSVGEKEEDSDEIFLGCVYRIELEDVRPPVATVVLYVTVARAFRGTLKPSDKIIVCFPTDILPFDPVERSKLIERRNQASPGRLNFYYLSKPKGGETRYFCDAADIRKFTKDLSDRFEKYYNTRPPPPKNTR